MKLIKFLKIINPLPSVALLFCCCLQLSAQTGISNIWAEEQNSRIAVHYTLMAVQPTDVNLQYSADNGLTWLDCKTISGDLRFQITGNKTILWDCLQDGYEKGSLLFRVIANEQAGAIPATPDTAYKKNAFGVDVGLGARKLNEWGTFLDVGLRYTHNFSPYIGWDVVNLRFQGLMKSFSYDKCLLQAMTGVRAYAPGIKGYASLRAGFGHQPFLEASGFAYELELGLHITQTLFAGFVFNSQNLRGEWEGSDFNVNCAYTGLRIGFNF